MIIRQAIAADHAAIAAIIMPTIRAGETYALDPAMGEAEAIAYWTAQDRTTFVAEDATGAISGTYYLRANQAGGGDHICNCGYMTHAAAAGRGVARAMAGDSFGRARERGFRAMQFNFVVASNVRAVALWRSLGFATVGRLPAAFRHPALGHVDALVMHRLL